MDEQFHFQTSSINSSVLFYFSIISYILLWLLRGFLVSDKPREHLCEESDRKRLRVCPTPALGALHSLSNESAKTDEPGRAGPGRPRTSGRCSAHARRVVSYSRLLRLLAHPIMNGARKSPSWTKLKQTSFFVFFKVLLGSYDGFHTSRAWFRLDQNKDQALVPKPWPCPPKQVPISSVSPKGTLTLITILALPWTPETIDTGSPPNSPPITLGHQGPPK